MTWMPWPERSLAARWFDEEIVLEYLGPRRVLLTKAKAALRQFIQDKTLKGADSTFEVISINWRDQCHLRAIVCCLLPAAENTGIACWRDAGHEVLKAELLALMHPDTRARIVSLRSHFATGVPH